MYLQHKITVASLQAQRSGTVSEAKPLFTIDVNHKVSNTGPWDPTEIKNHKKKRKFKIQEIFFQGT